MSCMKVEQFHKMSVKHQLLPWKLGEIYLENIGKGISDLKGCLDYSYHQARSLWEIQIFLPICLKWHTDEKKKSSNFLRKLRLAILASQSVERFWGLSCLAGKTNIQISKLFAWWDGKSRQAFQSEKPLLGYELQRSAVNVFTPMCAAGLYSRLHGLDWDMAINFLTDHN